MTRAPGTLADLPSLQIGEPRTPYRSDPRSVPIDPEILDEASAAAHRLADAAAASIREGDPRPVEMPPDVEIFSRIASRARLTAEVFEEDTGGRAPRRTIALDISGAETRLFWIDDKTHIEALAIVIAALGDACDRFPGDDRIAAIRGSKRDWRKSDSEVLCRMDPDPQDRLSEVTRRTKRDNLGTRAAVEIIGIADTLRRSTRKWSAKERETSFILLWAPSSGEWRWKTTPHGAPEMSAEGTARIEAMLHSSSLKRASAIPAWSGREHVAFIWEKAFSGPTMLWKSWVGLQDREGYPGLFDLQLTHAGARESSAATILDAWRKSARNHDTRWTIVRSNYPDLKIYGPLGPETISNAVWYSASREYDAAKAAKKIFRSLFNPIQVVSLEAVARYRTP